MRLSLIRTGAIVLTAVLLIAAFMGYYFYNVEPKIILTGDGTVEVTMEEGYEEPGYKAKYGFLDITHLVKVDSDVNDKKAGEYTVTYSVGFLEKSAVTLRSVSVVDREPPVITLEGGDSITVRRNSKFVDPGYTAQDDSDGDLTKSVTVKGIVDTYHAGTYTISYRVLDSFGNAAKKRRKVVVAGKPVKKVNKVIYLTFDDGPGDYVTPQILKTLKKYKVPATFFIVDYGDSPERIKLLKYAIAQGHTIGIHGYSHDYAAIYQSCPAFMDNITRLDEKIRKDLDYEPFLIRFPGGSSNTISMNYCYGIMRQLADKVQEEGYYYTDWNVDSTDASGYGISSEQIIASVESRCKKNRYNVVLMHDLDTKQTTADALPEIIKWARKNGYTFAAMQKGGPTVHHRINN